MALQPTDANAAIYYTLDGSLPSTNSLLYSGAFNLFSNATITASAFETNFINSASAQAAFVIQPAYFTSQGFSNDIFRLSFSGTAGSNYVLEALDDLINWTPLFTNVATSNLFDLFDGSATNFAQRFYRVRQQ